MALLPPPLMDQHSASTLNIKVMQEALDTIKKILKPPRDMGGGYKASGLNDLLQKRLLEMKQLSLIPILNLMANGSCHLQSLQNPSKRNCGMPGSSKDMYMHLLKITMICLTIIMAPGTKQYSKKTRHSHKKFMRIYYYYYYYSYLLCSRAMPYVSHQR